MLGSVLDVFRLRQYFNVIVRSPRHDRRRSGRRWVPRRRPAGARAVALRRPARPGLAVSAGRVARRVARRRPRIALLATGGSGALASVVGVARALEEHGRRPRSSRSARAPRCSGSRSRRASRPTRSRPSRSVCGPATTSMSTGGVSAPAAPTRARGFAGIVRGDRLEAAYRTLLGDMTLAEMPIPAYAPIWNVEENRVEFLGTGHLSRRHRRARGAHGGVASAVHRTGRARRLSLVRRRDRRHLPGHPCARSRRTVDVAIAVNGFYPPDFAGEDVRGWEQRAASIVTVAGQVRTAQQAELARVNLRRLRDAMPVAMIEPVPYEKVRGLGFYRQFLNNCEWPQFMRSGRTAGLRRARGANAEARLDPWP